MNINKLYIKAWSPTFINAEEVQFPFLINPPLWLTITDLSVTHFSEWISRCGLTCGDQEIASWPDCKGHLDSWKWAFLCWHHRLDQNVVNVVLSDQRSATQQDVAQLIIYIFHLNIRVQHTVWHIARQTTAASWPDRQNTGNELNECSTLSYNGHLPKQGGRSQRTPTKPGSNSIYQLDKLQDLMERQTAVSQISSFCLKKSLLVLKKTDATDLHSISTSLFCNH